MPGQSRQRLLLAAMEMFAEKGYRGASIRDIVEKVDSSVNSVNYYFGSKENLAVAVVEELKRAVDMPVASKPDEITSDFVWRSAVKQYVSQVVGMFTRQDVPSCYFSSLYRHESANLPDKKVTIHKEIVEPIFRRLEDLIALGVNDRNPTAVRMWTLMLWNGILGYALKHPDVISSDIPTGMNPMLFRNSIVEFIVEKCLKELKFTPMSAM